MLQFLHDNLNSLSRGDYVHARSPVDFFYVLRKDQRDEILKVSFLIGILSVGTSYVWWTHDWWTPETITGTRVGVEDFLVGFFAGGVMTVGYEILRKLHDVADLRLQAFGKIHAYCILISLGFVCSLLFWFFKTSSAFACFSALLFGAIYTLTVRPDLWKVSIGSGFVMLFASLPLYVFIVIFAPEWVNSTYQFKVLTGIRISNIPIEEFIFWFLSGLVFSPFYEVLNGLREYRK